MVFNLASSELMQIFDGLIRRQMIEFHSADKIHNPA
jgi:hypothetical protein